MFAGISTSCYYPELTEVALNHLMENGVKAVEIFANCETEIEDSFLYKLKAKADSHGAQIISIHPFTSRVESYWLFSDYNRRFIEGREYYKKFYTAANILGATSIVFHGDSYYNKSVPMDIFLERLGSLYEDALSFGINLCIENVYNFRSQDPDYINTITSNFPKAQFVLDINQTKVSEIDVSNYLSCMDGKIHHVHFSDNTASQVCLPPGTGTFDTDSFLKKLLDSGFNGALIIELYRDNYTDYNQLIDSYNYLSEKIDSIKKL